MRAEQRLSPEPRGDDALGEVEGDYVAGKAAPVASDGDIGQGRFGPILTGEVKKALLEDDASGADRASFVARIMIDRRVGTPRRRNSARCVALSECESVMKV